METECEQVASLERVRMEVVMMWIRVLGRTEGLSMPSHVLTDPVRETKYYLIILICYHVQTFHMITFIPYHAIASKELLSITITITISRQRVCSFYSCSPLPPSCYIV